ncbi:hypothetical protein JOF29_001257 [Kribbella aluminosa]|uniref:DUF2252 domain-containing protein n=1 Tax=Kribbella aluminosa TaxID=416017 RepID=A0ABS4UEV0_9ACTN|nr:DUF2252 family protein [Kribbella aluminosa]MBP2350174.1 hypothetical protein [Kribbella aluminosa]
MTVQTATAAYEKWLAARIPVVPEDLKLKHHELAGDPLRFLRGTYYLWLERVAVLAPDLLAGPQVPTVGDLHVENFGTWRDHRGVRRWGVNDFDELAWGPPTLDLLRLAVSAVLTPQVAISPKRICRVLLDAWSTAKPGRAVDLAGPGAKHLRALVPKPPSAARYYGKLREGAAADPSSLPAAVRKAVAVPDASWHRRQAGTGSLGHPRLVAVGHDLAREVKVVGPATADYVDVGLQPDDLLYGRILSTLRGPDPMRRIAGWQLRGLSPDVERIAIESLRPRAVELVLTSMAHAAADVHGAVPHHLREARRHVGTLPSDWLLEGTQRLTKDTTALYKQYAG